MAHKKANNKPRQTKKTPAAPTRQRNRIAKPSAKAAQFSQTKTPPAKTAAPESCPLVGIGASAGGLEALEQFFRHMPDGISGIAFVVVAHLDPSHASMMADLLKRFTSLKIMEARDGMTVEPDHVYVIPPNRDISIFRGKLRVTKFEEPRGLRMPINLFFRSLAEEKGEQAMCIILSGTGMDGTAGMKAVNDAGGMSMVQEPASARYAGMPESAIDTGLADFVLPPEKMPEQLLAYVKQSHLAKKSPVPATAKKDQGALQEIFMLLRTRNGHDFSLYKQNTVYRRIHRRMDLHAISSLPAYCHYLQKHPDEVQALFKELLISVTSFFRDPEAFAVLKKKVVPMLLSGKAENHLLRVWVPGCATGEEPYSIAMILREYMDEMKQNFTVQIFATDIDDDAIRTARSGAYPVSIASDVTPERLRRFFVRAGDVYQVKKEIRELVIFATQNITKNAPFTRINFISCRNFLIYLEGELQSRLFPLFHYSLLPGGILFLGSSESIGAFADLFAVVDKKWRFYQSKQTALLERIPAFTGLPVAAQPALQRDVRKSEKLMDTSIADLARKILLERFTPPCVIVNKKGDMLHIQGRTGKYLEPPSGQPSQNILKMAREGLQYELRIGIQKALAKQQDVVFRELQVKTNGGFQAVTMTIRPVTEPASPGLLMVVFEDVAIPAAAGPEKSKTGAAARRHKRIEELERELLHTRENLQATIEEMQAANEELQSANEELQSTNEELQSTNEELETSREELQSVNEELVTVNSELQSKIAQLTQAENDLQNLLNSIDIGIVFLDSELRIKSFTPAITRIVSLIQNDIGRPIGQIASNLKATDLVSDARRVLDTLVPVEKEAQLGDGTWYALRIMPYRTVDGVIDGVVVTFTSIDLLRQAEERLKRLNDEARAARAYAESIVETVREPLLILDERLRVISANKSFFNLFQATRVHTEGSSIYDLGSGQWNIPQLKILLEDILVKNTNFNDFVVEAEFQGIGRKTMLLNARKIVSEEQHINRILLAIEDITGRGLK